MNSNSPAFLSPSNWLNLAGLGVPRFPGIESGRKSVSFLGVELPKGPGGAHCPRLSNYSNYRTSEHELALMRNIALAWELDEPLLIESKCSSGWARTIDLMCAYLKREVFYLNCKASQPDMFLGGAGEGVAVKAMRRGAVLVLDEFCSDNSEGQSAALEILAACQSKPARMLLRNSSRTAVRADKDFRLICLTPPQSGTSAAPLPSEALQQARYLREIDIAPCEEIPSAGRWHRRKTSACLPGSLPRALPDQGKRLRAEPGLVFVGRKFEACLKALNEMLARGQVRTLHDNFQGFDVARETTLFQKFLRNRYWGDLNETAQRAVDFLVLSRFGGGDREMLKTIFADTRFVKQKGPARQALW